MYYSPARWQSRDEAAMPKSIRTPFECHPKLKLLKYVFHYSRTQLEIVNYSQRALRLFAADINI